MPLRDHFRPPLDNAHSWEELHGQWPAVIVQHLRKRLPETRITIAVVVVVEADRVDRHVGFARALQDLPLRLPAGIVAAVADQDQRFARAGRVLEPIEPRREPVVQRGPAGRAD